MTEWRKSSFSGGNTNCVEVASTSERVGVRDSKNASGPALWFPAANWRYDLACFPMMEYGSSSD